MARVGEWVVAGIAGLLLAGAGAARFVPPEILWPLQILAVALPALAAVLVALASVAGLRGRWGLVAFSLLPVGFILALSMLTAERDAEPAADRVGGVVPLKVVSFNAKPEAIAQGEAALQRLLAEEQPHLVALQEFPLRILATGEVGGSRLLVPFLENRAYDLARPEQSGDANIARPVFSRIEPVGSVDFLPAPFGQAPDALWTSGGLTHASYQWEGVTIAVYNVHLHSFSGKRPWEEGWRRMLSPGAWAEALRAYRTDFRTRAEQARVIRRFIDAETRPFLVLGDFNSTPSTWVYAHFSRGLRDAFREGGRGWGKTYPSRLPLVRIDYVLASPHWRVLRAFVPDGLSSDHRPVIAELVLMTGAGQEIPTP